ncbi:hypothetical protein ACI65C_002378, partial [Semiaphis heraclei]
MDKVNNSPVSTPAILSDIIQARANIKQKYSALKTGRFETEALINNTFSSIIEPLSEIRSNTKKKPFPTVPPSPPPPSSKPDVDSIEDSFSATPQSPPTTYSDLNARFGPWTQSVLDRIYGPVKLSDGVFRLAKKKASWKHITQFYEFDKDQSTEGDRLVPKLTDAHVYEEKIKKMKVSHAAQVFSQRVGAIMKRIAVMSNNCTPSIDREAADTGQLCLFVDNLFDSANGNVIKPTPGKDLRSAVTLTSPHWVFWSKALDVLRMINNFTSTHSVGANCEDDDSDGILDNLKDFLFNEIPLNEENEDEENCSAQHDALTTFPTLEQTGSLINSGSRAY